MKRAVFLCLFLCFWCSVFAGCEIVSDSLSSTQDTSSDMLMWSELSEPDTSESSVEHNSSETAPNPVSSKQNHSSVQASSKTSTSSKAAPTPSVSSEPVASKPAQQQTEAKSEIEVVSLSSPIGRNETALLKIKGKSNTEYRIQVIYASGPSEAAGLEAKVSDADGYVSWEWKIGGKTKPGSYQIKVTGGGETLETTFTVEE